MDDRLCTIILRSECVGTESDYRFEQPAEVSLICISDLFANLIDFKIRVSKQNLRLIDTDA